MLTTIRIPKDKMKVTRVEAADLWVTIVNDKLGFGAAYLQYKYKWSEEFARGAIREYRRFAFLALISNSEITPSFFVDEVWHCHILHTKDYEIFSNALGRKLHHSPGMPSEAPRFNTQYEDTLQLYADVFKAPAPEKYWPDDTKKASEAAPRVNTEPTIQAVLAKVRAALQKAESLGDFKKAA